MPTWKTSVDPAALWAAAQHLDSAADTVVAAVGGYLANLQFDGSAAGRAHADSGWAVRAALDGLAADLAQWGRAGRELAGALRAAAQQHAAAESHAETVLR